MELGVMPPGFVDEEKSYEQGKETSPKELERREWVSEAKIVLRPGKPFSQETRQTSTLTRSLYMVAHRMYMAYLRMRRSIITHYYGRTFSLRNILDKIRNLYVPFAVLIYSLPEPPCLQRVVDQGR